MRLTKSTTQLAREACHRHFWPFFRHAFGAFDYCRSKPEDDWVDPIVHRDIAAHFEHHVKWWMSARSHAPGRYIILYAIPRECGKSTMITEAGSQWCQVLDPDLCIGIGSYNDEKASDFLSVPKTLMEGRATHGLFTQLYGVWEGDDDKWTEFELTHNQRRTPEIRDPSFETASVKRGATGTRYDMYFLDDPVADRSSKDVSTQLETDIQQAINHIRKTWFVLKKNGLMVVCLTRKSLYDVATYCMRHFKVRAWAPTGMFPERGSFEFDPDAGRVFVYFMSGRDDSGRPTIPRIHSAESMKEIESRDPINFAAEIMNRPAEGAHMGLKEEHVERMWVERLHIPGNCRNIINIDTAFRDPKDVESGCYNAIVWSQIPRDGSGMVYYRRVLMGNTWTSDQFYEKLVTLVQELYAARQRIWCVTDEKEKGGKVGLFHTVYLSHFRAVGIPAPRLIQFERRTTISKAARIASALDYWLQDKVRLERNGEGLTELAREMLQGRFAPIKDVADAAADAFNPEVYTPEQGWTMETGPGEIRPYERTPVFAMKPEEKVAYRMQQMRERNATQERPHRVELPWWHRTDGAQ